MIAGNLNQSDNYADLVIVGGGPAGRTIAKMVKAGQPDWRVVVIKDEEINPNRCVIPYVFDGTVPAGKAVIPNTMVTDTGAELIVGTVDSIDPTARTISIEDRSFTYGKLVLATGAEPITPPVEGASLPGNFRVRSREDVNALLDATRGARRAIVVGMGLIGAEVAASLQRGGLEVTGIDALPDVLGAALDSEFAAAATAVMQTNGIKLMLRRSVDRVNGLGSVTGALAGGSEIPADIVVWAVGVSPRTDLAQQAGAAVEHDGIVVDDRQQTSLPDVYAVGDCTRTVSQLTGQPQPAKLGTTAVIQARVAAKQILGRDGRYPGTLASWACQLYDLPLGGVGLSPHAIEGSGFDVLTADAQTLSRYPQMPGVRPVKARVYFERGSLRVLGAQLLGTPAIAGYLDLLALAIDKQLTAHDLAGLQYATHPELAPKPSDNIIVFAAMDAIKQNWE